MDQWNYVGIDVSARSLEVALAGADNRSATATFANTSAGHRQLIKWATKRGRLAQVCLEATGVYSLEVALALHHHPKTEVMVINPKAIKNYAGATMQRAKTDAVDAQLILDYGQRMSFAQWQPPSDEVLQLQAITRRVSQLKVELNREANRLHAEGYKVGTTDLIEQDRKTTAGLMVLFAGTLAGGVQMVRISHRRRNEKRGKQVLQLAADKSGRITAEEVALVTNLSVEEGRKILDVLCLQGAAQMYVTAEGVMEYVFPGLTSS